jgi:cation diffusion facilitator family transporter
MNKSEERSTNFATKEKTAKLAIFSVSLLIVIKAVASILTGSIGIRADAVHSVVDLTGVIVGFIGIRVSNRPPDERHPFGHGKAENIAGTAIAILIFFAAATIIYEAINRLVTGTIIEFVTIGIYFTVAAIVINLVVASYVLKVARLNDSIALKAMGQDLRADMLSSCAVLVGLMLVRLTGLYLLDPLVALLVGALIARTAYLTMRSSLGGLMDTKLPSNEENTIRLCIAKHNDQIVGFHKLRTRKAGNQRHVDFHLMMAKDISLDRAHEICNSIEIEIKNKLPESSVTAHIEPCLEECKQCSIVLCSRRK